MKKLFITVCLTLSGYTIKANSAQMVALETEPMFELVYNKKDSWHKGLQITVFLDESNEYGSLAGMTQLTCADKINLKQCPGVSFYGGGNVLSKVESTPIKTVYELNSFNGIIPIIRVVVTNSDKSILDPNEWLNYSFSQKIYTMQIIDRSDNEVVREVAILPKVVDSDKVKKTSTTKSSL
jgi:hypothetical protein